MNQYFIQIKYNRPRTEWEDVERLIINKDDGCWPASIVQQRLHNWLVMYFHNIRKGATPSK
jgi:hypothetical protein